MPRFRTVAFSSAILSILILSTFCFAASPDRIPGSIVTRQTIRLAGNVPIQARAEFDQGAVDPSFQLSYITLLTVPSPAQQRALDKLLNDQQSPRSASYHKWLTPAQYADRFGLSSADLSKITNWLQSQGFQIVRTARGRDFVVFSGTAAQVAKAFGTEIHNFNVNGEMYFANVSSPSVPAALSGIVTGFHGLSNFRPKSQAQQADPSYTYVFKGSDFYFLAPGDIAAMYDVQTLYQSGVDGTGMTLAVMGQTGVYQTDLTNFRQNFGLSAISCTVSSDIITACSSSNFKYILVNGSATTISSGDLPEADLDLEWSGATARNAQIIYVNANDPTGFGVWDSWYYAVDNDVSKVITMSYTTPCELAEAGPGSGKGTFTSDEAELAKANSLGITFLNSSGDTGAAECDFGNNLAVYGYATAYPASSQYVTGVGGTSIPNINPNEYSSTYWNASNGGNGASAKGYIPEQPWNDAQEFGLLCATQACTLNHQTVTNWQTAQNAIGISGGGGGVSNCVTVDSNGVCTAGFPQPSWQSGISASAINPSAFGVTSTPARYSPDVSLLASPNFPGYLICTQKSAIGGTGSGSTCDSPSTGITDMLSACLAGTGPCSIFGGTSVSTPVFAGMMALLNQYLIKNGIQSTPGLSNINPTLYSLAAANSSNHAFNPVTTGSTGSSSNGAFCQQGTPVSGVSGDPWPAALQCPSSGLNAGFLGFNSYNADPTLNYNLVTGLGSVDANNLFTAWAAKGTSPDFTLAVTASPSSTIINTNVVWIGSLTALNGYNTAVTLSCTVGAPSTCTISPTSLTPTTSGAPFTVTVGSSTSGTFNFSIQGTDGTITHAQSVTLDVEDDFKLGAITSPPAASPGQTTTTSMQISTVDNGNFTNTVTYTCSSGLPTGATCTFSPASGTILAGATSPQTVSITLNTAGPFTGAAGGAVHRSRATIDQHHRLWLPLGLPLAGIIFVGIAGRRLPRQYQIIGLCLTLALGGLMIACGGGGSSATPVAVSVSPGSVSLWPSLPGAPTLTTTQQFTASVTGTTNTSVTWSVSGGSANGTINSTGLYTAPATVPAGSVTVTATSAADATKTGNATVNIKTPTPSGPYTVTVTVSEGSLQHTATLTGSIN
jgi:subtilase family serine protease